MPVSVQVGSDPANSPRYYYQYNGHGDVVALTDLNGASAATYAYDAFGALTTDTESFANGWHNPYRYDGRDLVRYDEETGLYWMSVRAYDPTLGRFLSRDPLGRAPLYFADAPYVYAGNNPLVNVYPSGARFVDGDYARPRVQSKPVSAPRRIQAVRARLGGSRTVKGMPVPRTSRAAGRILQPLAAHTSSASDCAKMASAAERAKCDAGQASSAASWGVDVLTTLAIGGTSAVQMFAILKKNALAQIAAGTFSAAAIIAGVLYVGFGWEAMQDTTWFYDKNHVDTFFTAFKVTYGAIWTAAELASGWVATTGEGAASIFGMGFFAGFALGGWPGYIVLANEERMQDAEYATVNVPSGPPINLVPTACPPIGCNVV